MLVASVSTSKQQMTLSSWTPRHSSFHLQGCLAPSWVEIWYIWVFSVRLQFFTLELEGIGCDYDSHRIWCCLESVTSLQVTRLELVPGHWISGSLGGGRLWREQLKWLVTVCGPCLSCPHCNKSRLFCVYPHMISFTRPPSHSFNSLPHYMRRAPGRRGRPGRRGGPGTEATSNLGHQ